MTTFQIYLILKMDILRVILGSFSVAYIIFRLLFSIASDLHVFKWPILAVILLIIALAFPSTRELSIMVAGIDLSTLDITDNLLENYSFNFEEPPNSLEYDI